MQLSGIGSRTTYMYDAKTKKLSTKDGQSDAFTEYFNGNATEETLQELNGYDSNRKRDIKNMMKLFECGALSVGKNTDIYEITSDIIDGGSTEYYVNGEKVFTAYNAIDYTYDEVKTFSTISQPFRTYKHQGYNPADNSINIAIGDSFNLGNGYRLTVREDCVWGEGYGSGSIADDEKMNTLVYGVTALIHFADQQWFSSMIDEKSTPMVLQMLEELGVDTSREFTINGTKCQVKNGRIEEVGNTHVVPNSIYEKARKRYEQMLAQPLTTWTKEDVSASKTENVKADV